MCNAADESPGPFTIQLGSDPTQGIEADWGNGANDNYVTHLSDTPSTFKISDCLGGINGDYVSLESVDHPGSYLRHAGYTLWLHPATDRYDNPLQKPKQLMVGEMQLQSK